MKSRMLICICAATLSLAAQTIPARISGSGQAMEGTWEYTAEQTSPPPVVSFRGLITFLPNGGVVGTDETNFGGLGPAGGLLQTTGQGEWVRIGDREFLVNIMKLSFDPRGRLLGWAKIKLVAQLQESLRSIAPTSGSFDFYGADGRLLTSGKFNIQAQRMELEMP